jgi:hypothetical protein
MVHNKYNIAAFVYTKMIDDFKDVECYLRDFLSFYWRYSCGVAQDNDLPSYIKK